MKLFPLFSERTQRGFALVEIVVGSAIISVVMLSVSLFFQRALEISRTIQNRLLADYSNEVGFEILKSLRADEWSTASYGDAGIGSVSIYGTPLYLAWNGTRWYLSQTDVDNTRRTIVTTPVFRDLVTHDIVVSGPPQPDTTTRKVTITTSWNDKSGVLSRSVTFYVMNIFSRP